MRVSLIIALVLLAVAAYGGDNKAFSTGTITSTGDHGVVGCCLHDCSDL